MGKGSGNGSVWGEENVGHVALHAGYQEVSTGQYSFVIDNCCVLKISNTRKYVGNTKL